MMPERALASPQWELVLGEKNSVAKAACVLHERCICSAVWARFTSRGISSDGRALA